MKTPKRIIVRAPNWVGDHVLALPFYWDLRRIYPDAQLTLLSLDNLDGVAYPKIFQEHWQISKRLRHNLSVNFNWAKRIANGKFDLGVSLPSASSAALLFLLGRVPRRVGFSQGGSDLLLTSSLPWSGRKSGKHKSELFRDLLRFMTTESLDRPADFECAENEETDLPRQNLIVVAPGASIPLREWPYFQGLLLELRKVYWAFRIVVVGTEGQGKWHSFLSRMGDAKIEDWVGKTSLSQLIELCRRSKLVIANDSGVAHLAATIAKTPTIAIFGPGDTEYVAPMGPNVELIRLEGLECSPCESAKCEEPFGYQECLKQLNAKVVMETVENLIPLH